MAARARYLTIADELRRRITHGELVPGAKVPSTRQIAAEWGVATATAAKVLTALSQEGLVRAEPRSGTVVAGPRNAPSSASAMRPNAPSAPRQRSGRAQALTRERIVRTAMAIADNEGLGVLTIRGVAARLGVAPMALYKHIGTKDELIVLMADLAFGERGYPARPPQGRRARLELWARTLWSLYRRHPWLAQLGPITRPLPLPNLATHAEFALSTLDGLGLGAAAMCDLHVLLFSYIQGIAVHLDREQQAAGASGLTMDDWADNQTPALRAIAADGRHPTFARMLAALSAEGYDLILDNLFELGLRALLDGLDLSA
ncbi:GntR family transcriptional regulator [Kibdelosporangium persicum]|uniref:Transcriptional regulatory protein PtsJ n=1 Tax=Kibdelosporangium persicum TaxID=2698649 RepID=A0ABX2EYX4_9PSEU|nr:GntR family transcriptional regulator [Kibdelosporangium persicum]NRN64224.1 Transcriptional regulatory protein PtsJ [Kibdelosporangium persicum]